VSELWREVIQLAQVLKVNDQAQTDFHFNFVLMLLSHI
jgi:hypothetical protein